MHSLAKTQCFADNRTVTVIGTLLLRACQHGIRCLTVFVTQNWVLTLSNVSWRHTFFGEILTRKSI